jgi:hypothetical protein
MTADSPGWVSIPLSVSSTPLVATCVRGVYPGSEQPAYVCRIGPAACSRDGVDMYSPYADVGMLWFREETVSCVSGMLKRRFFPTAETAWELVVFLRHHLRVSTQGVSIELVDEARCVIANGEEDKIVDGGGYEPHPATRGLIPGVGTRYVSVEALRLAGR